MKPPRPRPAGALMAALLIAFWMDGVCADVAATHDAAEAERQLDAVRAQLDKLERQLSDQVADRGRAEQALREAERSEAVVRRKLSEIASALATARAQLAALEKELAAQRAALVRQVGALEQQLRVAYVSGRDDWLRSALSQREPAELGRQLVYHSYMARQRSELIGQVRADLQKLEATQEALDRQRQALEKTEAAERAHLQELSGARERRKLALAEITAGIASRSEQAERLRAEARELESLVAELTRIFASLPDVGAVPFSSRKGKMPTPASGKILRKFGQARADGRLRWDGILVGAQAGQEVRAVHHGRVVYSDWLPGMGLLVVLEHGDGYLSLYGHNQDLLTEVGDWVDPGTVIAHVGDSGGQAVTGLYFEIRKDGAPLDPAGWLKR